MDGACKARHARGHFGLGAALVLCLATVWAAQARKAQGWTKVTPTAAVTGLDGRSHTAR